MHTIPVLDHGAWPNRGPLFSRRRFATAGLGALAACASPGPHPTPGLASLSADLETYVSFGPKNAGGSGDAAVGAWIETRLAGEGFDVERHPVEALAIEQQTPSLVVGEARAPVATHWTGPTGSFASASGPIEVWGAPAGMFAAPRPGHAQPIIIAHLPVQRWSSVEQPAIRQIVERAFAQGAAGLVLVTHGPTRELIALNRRLAPQAPGPIALMAPRAWPAIETALRANVGPSGTLEFNAVENRRQAFNVVARLDRSAPSTIVVSTPRSGWTECGGERGPGIGVFLALAAWAPRAFARHNLLFVCTSAHEFENAGAAAMLEELAPAPEATALWLHLGAGFAARDWHEMGGELQPLSSSDPQRFLAASPHLLTKARAAFAGLAGLETPYSIERGAAGELSHIIAAGYPAIMGMLGAHRFHHVAGDDMRCVQPSHVADVLEGTTLAMRAVLHP